MPCQIGLKKISEGKKGPQNDMRHKRFFNTKFNIGHNYYLLKKNSKSVCNFKQNRMVTYEMQKLNRNTREYQQGHRFRHKFKYPIKFLIQKCGDSHPTYDKNCPEKVKQIMSQKSHLISALKSAKEINNDFEMITHLKPQTSSIEKEAMHTINK